MRHVRYNKGKRETFIWWCEDICGIHRPRSECIRQTDWRRGRHYSLVAGRNTASAHAPCSKTAKQALVNQDAAERIRINSSQRREMWYVTRMSPPRFIFEIHLWENHQISHSTWTRHTYRRNMGDVRKRVSRGLPLVALNEKLVNARPGGSLHWWINGSRSK